MNTTDKRTKQVGRRSAGPLLSMILIIAAVLLGSCGAPRSPEIFCDVMDKHRQRYEAATTEALESLETGDLEGLLGGGTQMVAALGDLQMMWDELAEVSPDEIRTDVERVRDHNKEQLDAAAKSLSDPIGVLLGTLSDGLTMSGSYNRVNDYAGDHCGTRPF